MCHFYRETEGRKVDAICFRMVAVYSVSSAGFCLEVIERYFNIIF